MTDQYGVIGHPVAHSKSPVIHQLFAAQTGEDINYEAFDIDPAELAQALKELIDDGVRGLNVTVPHKQTVAELADELSERARLAAAVNTLTVADGTLRGDNTDGVGLITDLRNNLDIDVAAHRVLILGAGGATRGILPALLEAGPESLHVANRTAEKALALAAEFSDHGDVSASSFEELEEHRFSLIFNATSAGLSGDVPPFSNALIDADVICYDLSYAMHDTPFVAWAKEHGARQAHQGWGMLVEQAAESFLIWRGLRPETAPVLDKLP